MANARGGTRTAIRGEDTAIVAPLSVSSAGASTQGDLTASASALSMAPAPATTTPVSVDPHPVLTLWDRRVTIALALAVAAGVFAILWRQGLPPAVRPMAQVTPAVAATQRELPASIGGSATAMPSARAIGGQPAARSSDGASEVVRGIAPGIPQEDAPVVPSFRPVAEATDHPLPNGNAHAPVDDGATASPVATVPGTATTTFAGTATTGIPTPVATTSSVPGPPTAVGSATPTSPMAMLQSRPGVNTSPVFRVWHAPVAGR